MTGDQLKQVLKIDKGQVTLAATQLDDRFKAFKEKILAPYFQGEIKLNVDQLNVAGDSLTFQGKCCPPQLPKANAFNTTELDVDATFTVNGDPVSAIFRFQLPDPWSFETCCPELPLVEVEDESGGSADTSPLAALKFKDKSAFFVLATHDHQDPSGVMLKAGLSFVGEWNPGGMLGAFATIFSPSSNFSPSSKGSLTLHGSIVLDDAKADALTDDQFPWDVDKPEKPVPGILLEANLGGAVPLGNQKGLSFGPVLLKLYSPLTFDWFVTNLDYDPVTAYVGTIDIPIPNAEPVKATLAAEIPPGGSDQIVISGAFKNVTLGNLGNSLASLVGGEDAINLIPTEIQDKIGTIGLDYAAISLNGSEGTPKVSSTSVTIGTPELKWTPVEKLFEVGLDTVYLWIDDPFDSKNRSISASLKGQATIFGVKLAVCVEAPRFSITAEQIGSTTISIQKIFENEPFKGLPKPPHVMVGDIRFHAVPSSKYYAFSMRLAADSEWEIDGVKLPVANLSLTSGGWGFECATEPGTDIRLGKLIEAMAGTFGAKLNLPTNVVDLGIQRFQVVYSKADKDASVGDFEVTAEGALHIVEGHPVDVSISIQRQKQAWTLSGRVVFGTREFDLRFGKDKTTQVILAAYHSEDDQLSIHDLIDHISPKVAQSVPGDVTIKLNDALFAYKKAEESAFLFGVGFDIGARIDLANLGPIGSLLGGQEIGLEDLRVLVSSTDFSTDHVTALNKLLPDGIKALPVPSSEEAGKSNGEGPAENKTQIAISKGFNFSGNLKLGNLTPPPLMLPVAGAGEAPPRDGSIRTSDTSKQSSAESSTAKWIDIKRSLGPLYFGRVGFQYRDAKIGLLLDAAVDLAGLRVGLLAFQIRFPLQALTGKERPLPEFDLEGLELAYATGPVQISGSFLRFREKGKPDQYDGMALIKAANFMIAGLGSYTTVAGAPSMFIYAVLHAELGGPPFFRVQGLAAGFGYNRRLTLPPIEEVHKFPLVRAALDENFITKDMSVGDVLGTLRDYISPSSGDYWLAAGIRFSSFEMIQAFALLSVSFGHEVEIGLLGAGEDELA